MDVQDLNSSKSYWRHARTWFGKNREWHMEWVIPDWRHFGFGIDLATHDTAINFSLHLLLVTLYVGLDSRRLYQFLNTVTRRKGEKYTNGRSIGIEFREGGLYIDLWNDTMEWSSTDPKWWRIHIDFADLILGEQKYSTTPIESGESFIDMPEGRYFATYEVSVEAWNRPRWPLPLVRESIYFKIPAGIPVEGKGESSYDIDMDATFGRGTEWKGDVRSAAKRVALLCLEGRQRRGALSSPAYAKWFQERQK